MTDGFEESVANGPVKRDYVHLLVRRRWYIIAPLFVCGAIGAIIAQFWPLLYRSEALIIVEQQKVPEQYVTPNVITTLQTRLDAMKQQILSRTRLQGMIESFDLYPQERQRMNLDDVIDRMRKAIGVELVPTPGRAGEVTGFRISYLANRASTAQRITNELVSQFINESIRQRAQQSDSTTQFFQSELEAAHRSLEQQEAQLREYKLHFLGELPEQEQGSLQILSSLQAQLYTAGGALERAEQQRTYLQSMREQYRSLVDSKDGSRFGAALLGAGPKDNKALQALDAQLAELNSQLATAKLTFTPTFPEVRKLSSRIAELERARKVLEDEAAAKQRAAAVGTKDGTAAETAAVDPNSAETTSRLKALEVEIANHKKNIAKLEGQIQELQDHLRLIPVREQQLASITRASENARLQYQSLLQKKLQSELANNLEKRQQGEQFRILDSASLPHKPEGLLTVLTAGWFLGLFLGVGSVIVLEVLSPVIYGAGEIELPATLQLFPIPLISSPREERRRAWVRRIEVLAAVVLMAVSFGATIHRYLLS